MNAGQTNALYDIPVVERSSYFVLVFILSKFLLLHVEPVQPKVGFYKASPKAAAMPPTRSGVPYSRARARAVAAPDVAEDGEAAVEEGDC
jgi:hypothetical protein